MLSSSFFQSMLVERVIIDFDHPPSALKVSLTFSAEENL
jgi:hypothetical protein